jgi:hypothetical protein
LRRRALLPSLGGKAGKEPVEFDRNGDVYKQLSAVAPAVTVDASGPFQTMGGDACRAPRACISLGYADLADCREFVRKIADLDAECIGQEAPRLRRTQGGMFVRASGSDRAGQPLEASWHLVAEGDDGPFVPVTGPLIRKLANGNQPADGRRSAAR